MTDHPVVTREEWLRHRLELLSLEKELTRRRDELSALRRTLPWTRVDKSYDFDGPEGLETLSGLFDGCSQLIVYHFMFAPKGKPCPSCAFWADSFNGIGPHLRQRDTAFVAISRAHQPALRAFAQRMHWTFKWVSSWGGDFNADFGVAFTPAQIATGTVRYNYGPYPAYGTEMPGVSVFYKDGDGAIYHTYSCYARGLDPMNAAYSYLDLTPMGRAEENLPYAMAWLRYRDEYGA